MNRLITLLLALSCASCVSQFEAMQKPAGVAAGAGGVASYVYHYGQIGGQGTAQSSMGTAVAFDGQKSFADFMQFAATYATLDFGTKQILYKELTKRFNAGQITARQKIAADAAIAQSSTAAELNIALAKIAAGQ